MYNHGEQPTVSARGLHEKLHIETPFKKWIDRMCEYGFEEFKDFWTKMSESTGGRPSTVSARALHKALDVQSRFSRWFDSNKELFVEGEDYTSVLSGTVVNNGGNATDLPPTEMYRIGVYKVLKSELLKNSGFYKLCKSVQERTTSLKL